jgi:hypothetical protein
VGEQERAQGAGWLPVPTVSYRERFPTHAGNFTPASVELSACLGAIGGMHGARQTYVRRVAVNTNTINFEITDVRGRKHVLRALNVEGGEWLLQTCIDGRVFTHRCRDWQGVERTIRSLRARSADRSPAAASSEPGSTRALVAGLLLFVSILATSVGSAQQLRPDDADGITRFVRAAEDYAVLHRRLEHSVPSVQVDANPETIRHAIDAVAAVIRAARRDAKPGDVFNPAAQATIRARIDQALRSHGFSAEDVLAAERAEGVDPGAVELQVNDTFPWAISTAMFRCVLEALPPLPAELMYRIIGRDLFLIDVHAGLIVDILPFALADVDSQCCSSATEGAK